MLICSDLKTSDEWGCPLSTESKLCLVGSHTTYKKVSGLKVMMEFEFRSIAACEMKESNLNRWFYSWFWLEKSQFVYLCFTSGPVTIIEVLNILLSIINCRMNLFVFSFKVLYILYSVWVIFNTLSYLIIFVIALENSWISLAKLLLKEVPLVKEHQLKNKVFKLFF